MTNVAQRPPPDDASPALYSARVVPPRELVDTMEQAGSMFGALGDTVSVFDLIIDSEGPSWWVRARSPEALERTIARVRRAWPDATIVSDGPDPGVVHAFEQCVRVPLVPDQDPALPLRGIWRDGLSRNEVDPLEGIAAHAHGTRGLRVISRLAVRRAPSGVARAIVDRREDRFAERDAKMEAARVDSRSGPSGAARDQTSHLELLLLLGLMLVGTGVWFVWTRLEWWHVALFVFGALLLGAALGAFVMLQRKLARALWNGLIRLFSSGAEGEPLPDAAVEQKLSYPLLEASLVIYAAAPARVPLERLEAVADEFGGAYREFFGGAAGGELASAKHDRRPPGEVDSIERRDQLILNSREASAIWHLPVRMGAAAGVERGRAVQLMPAPGTARRGLPVGADPEGQPVFQSLGLAMRNQLIFAKTRRGKSTLMRHIADGLMRRDAADFPGGRPALIVMDPHRDLALDVLDAVPPDLEERTVFLDFANLDRPIGLNLLDVHTFPDRDRQVANIITMMNRLWPQNWGPRMEGVLRNALLALHTVNVGRPPHAQHTLLDVSALLMDTTFREEVLNLTRDPAQRLWWRDNFDTMGLQLQRESANPVVSKIGYFLAMGPPRLIFGQARTTFDPSRTIRDGGVLLINTASGTLGEGAASLLGATMINLLSLMIEAQVELDPARRRQVVVLIDESSTLGAIDYVRMLSELGKFGGSFKMATQSLSKLDAIDKDLTPAIFANIDGLTVFQSSAEDALRLQPELGDSVSIEDLVSLDDFTAYARWWEDGRKGPAFSFGVNPPPRHDNPVLALERRRRIAGRSHERYGRDRGEVEREIERVLLSHLGDGSSVDAASGLRAAVEESGRTTPKPRGAGAGGQRAAAEGGGRGGRARGGRGRGARPRKDDPQPEQQQMFPFDERPPADGDA